MTLVTGYLSSRQVIERSKGCQASGFATGRTARQISKIGVHRQGHAGMGPKILSGHVAQWVFVACVSLCVLHAQADTVPFCFLRVSPRVLCLSADKHNNNNTTTICHEAAVPGTNELLSSGNLGSTTLPQGVRHHDKPQLDGLRDAKRRRTGPRAAEAHVDFAHFSTEHAANGVVRAVATMPPVSRQGAVTMPPVSRQGAAMTHAHNGG